MNFRVGVAGSQFFRDQGVRSDADRVSSSDEGRGDRENWPQPCGLRRKSRHTALSSSLWNRQSLRPPPCLARFPSATTPAGEFITASREFAIVLPRLDPSGVFAEDAVVLYALDAGGAGASDCFIVNYFILQP